MRIIFTDIGWNQTSAWAIKNFHRQGDEPDYEFGAFFRETKEQLSLLFDIFGNPFRSVAANPRWLTLKVIDLATAIYQDRLWDLMPIR